MDETIKLGIAGLKAGRHHASAFCSLEGVDVLAACDPSEAMRCEIAQQLEIGPTYETFEEMIQLSSLDAVVIATPTAQHARQSSAALDAGLHVLCESPATKNSRELSQIMTTASLVGKTYMWSQPDRFSRSLQAARKLIEEDRLGVVYHAEAKRHISCWNYGIGNWRSSIEDGGGSLLELAIRAIDSCWFVMGCPDPTEAMASAYNLKMNEFVSNLHEAADDSTSGMVRFKNGASMNFSAMFASHDAQDDLSELKLYGSKSSIDLTTNTITQTIGTKKSTTEFVGLEPNAQNLYLDQAKEFVAAILEEREPLNSAKHALSLMKLADAIRESAKEKRAVSIKAERTLDDLFSSM